MGCLRRAGTCAHWDSAPRAEPPPARRSPPVSRRSLPTSGARAWTRAHVNAQGLTPLKRSTGSPSTRSRDGPSVADLPAQGRCIGREPAVRLFPPGRFQELLDERGLRRAGRTRTSGQDYYFDKRQEGRSGDAYEKHRCQGAGTLGRSGRSGGGPVPKTVLAFETRLARASKSSEDMARAIALAGYNPHDLAAADKLTAEFLLTAFFARTGRPGTGRCLARHPGIPPGSQPDA